jgi:molecular chaperone GrpE
MDDPEKKMDEEVIDRKEGAPELTEAGLQELREKASKADQYYDQLLRVKADLENVRKRAGREREEIIQRANEHLLRELFSVLDHFDLGLQTARSSESKQGILEGMELVQKQLELFLHRLGIEAIDGMDQEFDPNLHEAIAHQNSDKPAGIIVAQTRKGYRLKGHVLRHAAVVVSKGPAA